MTSLLILAAVTALPFLASALAWAAYGLYATYLDFRQAYKYYKYYPYPQFNPADWELAPAPLAKLEEGEYSHNQEGPPR